MINKIKKLDFNFNAIEACFIKDAENYYISDYSIVINIGMEDIVIEHEVQKFIPKFSSSILKDVTIKKAGYLIQIKVRTLENINQSSIENLWKLFGDTLEPISDINAAESFPRDTPLWISPQLEVCNLSFDPFYVLSQTDQPEHKKDFLVKVNLWFAQSNTNCFIHNTHPFIEVHTQIFGNGRMQKFKDDSHLSLTEDILMSPGFTTNIPFCSATDLNTFVYPWHQYYSDTHAIWLAIEYHPM